MNIKMTKQSWKEIGEGAGWLRTSQDSQPPRATSLDGMNRKKAANRVNTILAANTKGFFSDESWEGVNKVWQALTDAGIDWTMLSSSYYHNSEGVPSGKTWKFNIDFLNDKSKPAILYGIMTASGAGSVVNPLERYDLTAYVG